MHSLTRFAALAAIVALAAGGLTAYTNGSPGGKTGAPGQNNCRQCHNTYALNSGPATFDVVAPASIAPGDTVPLSLYFGNTTESVFGFEVTVRSSSGGFLGSWAITDPQHTRTANQNGVTHTSNGATRSSWSVDWVAPLNLTDPYVTFYASGVEANGGNGDNNDHVYTVSKSVPIHEPLFFTASSTNANYSMTLNGGPGRAGEEFYVLASANPLPGPMFGLTPDSLTFLVLLMPVGAPGLHSFLDGTGATAAVYPPGTLASLSGATLRAMAVTLDASRNLTGFSDIVTLSP